jgi:hypothetical protein
MPNANVMQVAEGILVAPHVWKTAWNHDSIQHAVLLVYLWLWPQLQAGSVCNKTIHGQVSRRRRLAKFDCSQTVRMLLWRRFHGKNVVPHPCFDFPNPQSRGAFGMHSMLGHVHVASTCSFENILYSTFKSSSKRLFHASHAHTNSY